MEFGCVEDFFGDGGECSVGFFDFAVFGGFFEDRGDVLGDGGGGGDEVGEVVDFLFFVGGEVVGEDVFGDEFGVGVGFGEDGVGEVVLEEEAGVFHHFGVADGDEAVTLEGKGKGGKGYDFVLFGLVGLLLEVV